MEETQRRNYKTENVSAYGAGLKGNDFSTRTAYRGNPEKEVVTIEIDSDSDQEIDLKKKDGTEMRSIKSNLQLLRTMNKRRFEEPRQLKPEERDIFA